MPTGLANRVLGVVLRAYPASFRAHYAREMLVTLRDQRRALPKSDRWSVARFWARSVADLLRSAAVERIASGRASAASLGRRGVLRSASGLVLLLLAVANVAYDLAHPTLTMGLQAILLTTLSALAGVGLLRRRRLTRVARNPES